jgi:hypothetical protein
VERPLGRHGQQAAHGVGVQHAIDDVAQRGVGEDVAVVGEEHLVVVEVGPHAPQALADGGVDAGVDERDAPLADVGAQQLDVLTALAQHEVVGVRLLVVEEVVLHRPGAVAQAQDELGVPEVGVVPHDVPQHRTVADGHHRLGRRVVARPDAQPQPATEQHDLHGSTSSRGSGTTSRPPQSRT